MSPTDRNKDSLSSPSTKLPTLKQLESKLQAVEKKSEELGDLFIKKYTNRDGFTKVLIQLFRYPYKLNVLCIQEYAFVLRERDELVARIKYGEYRDD